MLSPHDQCCRLLCFWNVSLWFYFPKPLSAVSCMSWSSLVLSSLESVVCLGLCLTCSGSLLQQKLCVFFLSVLSFRPVLGGSIQDHLDVLLWLYACLSISSCVCVRDCVYDWAAGSSQPGTAETSGGSSAGWPPLPFSLCHYTPHPVELFFFFLMCVCVSADVLMFCHTHLKIERLNILQP